MRPSPLRLMDHREFPLLYVDDEVDNLRIFELTFRRDFTIFTASNAREGLEILNENPVAVVLSDQRMPGMTGVEFLSRVRALDPTTLRILITAYGDVETLGIAINDGSIYRYIPKPWEPEDLRMALCRAIETYALDRERDALIRELTQLNQLSRDLHSELDLEKLISTLLRTTHRDLGFDGVALLFFDESQQRLHWAGVEPAGDSVAKSIQKLEISTKNAGGFIAEIQLGCTQALRLENLKDLPRVLREWLTEVSADEILVVPLMGKQGVAGILAVDNRSGGRRFGADDQTLMDGIATQAVVAIENARIVDDLRNARHQVQRADRLGTLGTLAAGLAHEINNPLVSVQTFVSMAPSKRCDADSDFWETYHALASTELDRIRDLVLTMSRLAHGGDSGGTYSEVCMLELAREVRILLQAELHDAGVILEVECPGGSSCAWGVRAQLHQVLLNLICNAIHATPADGRIEVRIQPDRDASTECIRVEVQDSGQGIAEENLERIFDPFFTTKDPDLGTGLGLMITHQIVRDHAGSIEVRSRAGEGAVFCVRLPVKAGSALISGTA